jgi:hypothetical protein
MENKVMNNKTMYMHKDDRYHKQTYRHSKIHACKEVGLEVKIQKTKDMLLSHHQNVWQNHNVTTVNISENVAHFKHFEKTVRNKILI